MFQNSKPTFVYFPDKRGFLVTRTEDRTAHAYFEIVEQMSRSSESSTILNLFLLSS